MEAYDIPRRDLPWVAWVLALFAGFTMVSSIRFYSGTATSPSCGAAATS
jgi:hypothetical protein